MMQSYNQCRKTCPHHFLFLLSCLLLSYFGCQAASKSSISTQNNIQCTPREREALLNFKQGIESDPCGLLNFWTDDEPNQDCCEWYGVSCNNRTGHVIKLDLHENEYYACCLRGNVSRSLLELKHMRHLDLSNNDFQGQPIPSFIGSLNHLKYLNLANSSFGGEIPHQLANLSSLTSLDLSFNVFQEQPIPSFIGSLIHLEYLNLADSGFGGEIPHQLPNLSSLTSLDLSANYLTGPIPIDFQNMSFLSHLDLWGNRLEGPVPNAIFRKLKDLSYIDLSRNFFNGSIPDISGNLHSLSFLSLSRNSFNGLIPNTIGNLHSLSCLDLSGNKIKGRIPSALGNMHSLSILDLSNNEFQGSIPDAIGELKSLEQLSLSNNSLSGTIPDSLALLPRLSSLDLSRNHLTGVIPPRLGMLRPLHYISLSSNNLSGSIPLQFANFSFDSFDWNVGLWGEPLSWHLCPQDNAADSPSTIDAADSRPANGSDEEFYVGLYVSIALGFYVGFCGFFATLALKNSWRHCYFQFLECIINWIYVIVAIRVAKFQGKPQTELN